MGYAKGSQKGRERARRWTGTKGALVCKLLTAGKGPEEGAPDPWARAAGPNSCKDLAGADAASVGRWPALLLQEEASNCREDAASGALACRQHGLQARQKGLRPGQRETQKHQEIC